ncbi:hypothetical protein BDZ89DRAFT_1154877 [Hymenopellis radicata]|nr:hypothetical protein BDZ89DRAFT_1154877 [Hymenopellis radicata]
MSRPSLSSIESKLAIVGAQLEILRVQEDDLQRHIDDFQRHIDALQCTKDATTLKRASLESMESHLEAAKYPINWLPVELLTHVFLLSQGNPFTLAHVNRKWHDVAVSTPALWTSVSAKAHSALVALLLKRSKNALLDVTLANDTRLLVDQGNRIRTLVAHYSDQFWLRDLVCHLNTTGPPELVSLELIFTGELRFMDMDAQNNDMAVLAANRPNSSKLASLVIDALPPLSLSPHLYQHLTALSISFPVRSERQLSLQSLLKVLTWTPRLVELSLHCAPMKVADNIVFPTVCLPHLQSLEWSKPWGDMVFTLLQHLNVPALTKLDLYLQGPFHPPHPPHVHSPTPVVRSSALETLTSLFLQSPSDDAISYIARKFTFPTLRAVELANTKESATPVLPKMESLFHDPRLPHLTHMVLTAFTLENVPAMLGYLPSLLSLTLDACKGMKSVLDALVKGRCPRLKSITFLGCDDLGGVGLVTALSARCVGIDNKGDRKIRRLPAKIKVQVDIVKPVMIETVRILECPGVEEEDVEVLRRLGIDVVCEQLD